MFVKKPWKWTLEHWEVTGTRVNTKPAVVIPKKKNVVKEDSASPQKKARKEAPVEASEDTPAESSEKVHSVARSEVTTTVGGEEGWYHHKMERDRDIISKQRDRDIISKHYLST
ncbi:unnamed protein product [Brassica oleracea]